MLLENNLNNSGTFLTIIVLNVLRCISSIGTFVLRSSLILESLVFLSRNPQKFPRGFQKP